MPHKLHSALTTEAGFSLVELVIITALLAVMSYVAIPRAILASSEATLPTQSAEFAQDIRHAQMLATTWERPLLLSVISGTSSSYSVACAVIGSAPCDRSVINPATGLPTPLPVIDPSSGRAFSVNLKSRVTFTSSSTMNFDTRGVPNLGAAFTLIANQSTQTVRIQALSGFVTVTTP